MIQIAILIAVLLFMRRLPFIIRVIRWNLIDLYRFFKGPRKIHLYGVWMFCGLPGAGKTVGMTEYLYRMRKKYGDKIYISTNYGFEFEDFPLKHWEILLEEYDRPVIFGYDEIQNEFSCRDYKNFPYSLVKMLTQNRKGNGKQIVCSAQIFTDPDKHIRDLCNYVYDCKTVCFNRVTKLRKYLKSDYLMYMEELDYRKKNKIPCSRYSFIQDDYLRSLYDSYALIESSRNKEYLSADEKLISALAERLQ